MHIRTEATRAACLAILLTWLAVGGTLLAAPTTEQEAEKAVTGWLRMDPKPMGIEFGQQVAKVASFMGADGQPVYYIVYVQPSGFVVVPADDEIEPIIAFSLSGSYDPSPDNPLGALVTQDLNGRMARVREVQAAQGDEDAPANMSDSGRRWTHLVQAAEAPVQEGLSSVSDVRVAPFVQSKWSQSRTCSNPCYNYYTPNGYPCGCVATATAQLMRFHQHPAVGIGVKACTILVDGATQTVNTRGGDGLGGAYDWDGMVLAPDCDTTTAQRAAIGALCYDAGLAVTMSYTSSDSGADALRAKDALTGTFGYSRAVKGYNNASNIGAGLDGMVNPNLDARQPVILGISRTGGGHAIIADGYGYAASTLYHHLNMGWAGSYDAWYNLPDIDSSPAYTSVYKCVYNVFVTGTGEIISGRVTDEFGDPVSGATVTGQRTAGGTYDTVTDSRGIYALAKVPSASGYIVSVTKPGYLFADQSTSTGTSDDYASTSGNIWGLDFIGYEVLDDPPAPTASVDVWCDRTLTRADPPPNVTYYWQGTSCGETTGNSSVTYIARASGTYYLRARSASGHWRPGCGSVTVSVNPILADLDCDGDVDLDDSGIQQRCLSGWGITQSDAACRNTDLNGDTWIDTYDYAILRGCMGGANLEPDPGCLP